MDKLDMTLPAELREVSLALPDEESDGITKASTDGSGDGGMAGAAGAVQPKEEQQTSKHGERSMAELTKDDIRKEVEAIFTSKEAQKQVEARIATAEAEKAALAQELNAAKAANQNLKTELDASKAALATKTTEFETLSKEKEEVEATAEKASKELSEIRAEKVVAQRSSELAEAKLLLPEGDKRTAQLAKVKSMTDETFASYKAELAEVAGQAAAAAKPAATPPAAAPAAAPAPEKAAASAPAAEGEEAETEKAIAKIDGINAPDVSQAQALQHAIAAASEQVALDADNVSLYAQL